MTVAVRYHRSCVAADLLTVWNERLAPGAGLLAWRLGLAVLAVLAVLVVARLALGAMRRALSRTRAHANARLLLDRLAQFAFLLLAGVWVLSIFGVQLTALVAVLGVASLAVSLAMQDVLKNLVAGLYILVERPFTIGEQIDFRTFSGVVETIELRTTALRTASSQRVVIPNAMLFADVLVNRSAYGRQLARVRVVLPLKAAGGATAPGTPEAPEAPKAPEAPDPQHVTEDVRQALQQVEGTVDSAAPDVLLESLTADKLTLRAEVWTREARATAAQVAWIIRGRLPQAEITVLE